MSHQNSFCYRIYYEDTDAGGVVYYANYLKFFERARTDFLRSLGILQSELSEKENVVFVVKKCEIEYFLPAKLDDEILVDIEVKGVNAASIFMRQKIIKTHSQIDLKNQKILSTLEVEIVCVDSSNFRPKRIPTNLRGYLQSFGV